MTTNGGEGGGWSTGGKLVALSKPVDTLLEQKLFSKPRLSLSYIAMEERKLDGEHLVVKSILCDIEVNVFLNCGISQFIFINENFVHQYNLPLQRLKVPQKVEEIDRYLI